MPAIVGVVQVISISSSAVVHIGDAFQITPTATNKTFAGAGSFNTGDGMYVVNEYSTTNTQDQDVVDLPIALTL
ncbi:spore germination protein [Bacillus fonticola]|uniref:spore germination protein n=1 Tax=Bacillus fonticola TaxID=2728853 RepID=UPI00147653C0|nr:spore germination protein [Bacillus fonticola]